MPQNPRRDPGRGGPGQLLGHCQARRAASPMLRLLWGSRATTERAGGPLEGALGEAGSSCLFCCLAAWTNQQVPPCRIP